MILASDPCWERFVTQRKEKSILGSTFFYLARGREAPFSATPQALISNSHLPRPQPPLSLRRQTLAFKAFLTSGATIFGLVVGADTVLLSHEGKQRSEEEMIRRRARTELGRQGIVASEGNIEKWKDETRNRVMRERAEESRREYEEQTMRDDKSGEGREQNGMGSKVLDELKRSTEK